MIQTESKFSGQFSGQEQILYQRNSAASRVSFGLQYCVKNASESSTSIGLVFTTEARKSAHSMRE
jgi:hypothetical protein